MDCRCAQEGDDRYLRIPVVLARLQSPHSRYLAVDGLPEPSSEPSAFCGVRADLACPHPKTRLRLYLVAQLTTAIALASWHTAPVIPSMRRAALSPVQ